MNLKRKVKKLINKNFVGIFITQSEGRLYSRPIAYAEVDEENNVWFSTDINSGKIAHINSNNQVNFSFANQNANEYVSLTGTAAIITDPDIIDEKWQFYMKAWWPEGKEGERLTLVRVEPELVEYWDGSSSKAVQAYDVVKALVTGKSYVNVSNSKNEVISYECE